MQKDRIYWQKVRIYLASSWRNEQQQEMVVKLREQGFEVYDFKNPVPGNKGFSWSQVDPNWKNWTSAQHIKALHHCISRTGFTYDFNGMNWANCGVLLLPCGKDAHLEAGWLAGAGKRLFVLLEPEECEPGLMYRIAYESRGSIFNNVGDLIVALKNYEKELSE